MELKIYHNGREFDVSNMCEGDITLTSEKTGMPSSLKFNVLRELCEDGFSFLEGDMVTLRLGQTDMFKGYVFSKGRNKLQNISVVCYDQLRYLKNKDTYKYSALSADRLILQIARDYNLETGYLEAMGQVFSRIEEGQTLFDIINNNISLATNMTGRKYVFYDDFGRLTLKSLDKMYLPFMLAREDSAVVDFNYKTDIDSDTCNAVMLYFSDKRSGRELSYETGDSKNQKSWGILKFYKSLTSNEAKQGYMEYAESILKEKNRVKKHLAIECLVSEGEENIRAGNVIFCRLEDLAEISVNSWLVIEKCTHKIRNGEHIVRLEFSDMGGEGNG